MAVTIVVTGFGPFPGAPFNPTGPLIERLARTRRPALADVNIITHVFPTSYAAVDRDLPKLIARHKPDALLMFGLAPRARMVRIETRARNVLALLPDASGQSPRRRVVAHGAPAALAMPVPAHTLVAALRTAGVPTMLSRDAGRYLCNYLCWRAVEAAQDGGPRLTAFVHVPSIAPAARRATKRRRPSLVDLARAGNGVLIALAAAARR